MATCHNVNRQSDTHVHILSSSSGRVFLVVDIWQSLHVHVNES